MNQALVTVIDDERHLLLSYQVLLECWGYTVIAASSLEEALLAMETAGRAPDVIISDYRLEDGKTGIDAIRSIKGKFGQAIPAVLVTGDSGVAHSVASDIGVRVLAKPVSNEVLLGALRSCLTWQNPTPST